MSGLGFRLGLCALAFATLGAGADDTPSAPLWSSLEPGAAHGASLSSQVASFADLVERARKAVVAIHTRGAPAPGSPGESFPFDPWRLFPDVPGSQRVEGIGSGFVIRADGLVVTNHHVIEGADRVWVRIAGMRRELPARVVGADGRSDLALLSIEASRPLHVLPLGDSGALRPGAWVVAIGNPFGLTHVATKGIVSGKGRTLGDLRSSRPGFYDYIQTDAAIDRGNSGGPLLNLRGEVVGINTAINSRARGIGFAVPVDLAKAVLPHLHRRGSLVRSYLGITIEDVDWDLARSLSLEPGRGVVVTSVRKGKPAAEAGLLRGDVILVFGGKQIAGRAELSWRAATWPAGRPVRIQVWRGGREVELTVTPVARTSDIKGRSVRPPAAPARPSQPEGHGLKVAGLDERSAKEAGLPAGTTGVVVVACQGEAAEHGIRVGDVIVEVDGKAVTDAAGLVNLLGKVETGRMIRFYIYRQRSALFVALEKRWKD